MVKVPVWDTAPNGTVDLTFSVPPLRSCEAPSTVVVPGAALVSWKKSPLEGCSGNVSPVSMVFQLVPSKRWMRSSPLTRIPASMSRPRLVTVALLVVARLVILTLFTETPTPIPTVPAASALPLPVALASVLASVLRVKSPPLAVTLAVLAREASEREVTMLMAAAPATVTVLPLDSFVSDVVALALLVSVVLEVLPVSVLLWLLALLTWSLAFPLTSLPEVSSPLPSAPVALASASVTVADEPVAVRLTDLALAMVRDSVAITSSSGIASASARPITTVPLTASAFAVVVALAFWVALRLIASDVLRVSNVPPAIVAVVSTVGSAIAASAVRLRVEPLAPAVPASA